MMSSTLAMVLAAAMAVPGIGPEVVSAEMKEGLDLRGEWEGTFRNYHGACSRFRLSNGDVVVVNDQMEEVMGVRASFADEGKGKVRWCLGDTVYLGIYQQECDRFFACFSNNERPKNFQLTERRCLLKMHRVKPRE